MRRTLLLVLLLSACSGAGDSTSTIAVPSTSAPVTTAPASTTTTTAPGAPSGPFQPLPVLPVGPDDIEYRGGGDEIESFGPTSLAVGRDGTVHIVDPVSNRILSFGPGGESVIDLGAIDVLSAPFIAAASDHLVVVEIFFAPLREKVHRIGFDGSVISSFQLPIAGRLESGLAGAMVDDADRIHLVIEAGIQYLQLDDETLAFMAVESMTKYGSAVAKEGTGVSVNGELVSAELIGEFGGVRLLDVAADGTVVLVREDVVTTSPVEVVVSVEWWSPEGEFLGSAPVDLNAQAIDAPPGLAVAPDGSVVVMYAREDVVEVIELERSTERFGV